MTDGGSNSGNLLYYTEVIPYDGYLSFHYITDGNEILADSARFNIALVTSENPMTATGLKWGNLHTGLVDGVYVKKGSKIRFIATKFQQSYILSATLYY